MVRFFLIFCIIIFSNLANSDQQSFREVTLEDAILLSVRENPNVQRSKLSYISQKYSLELAKWKFKPQYTLSANRQTSKNYSLTDENYVTENANGVNFSAALLTPIGTRIKVSPSADQSDHFHPGVTLEIIQPLLKGFGKAIVEADLKDAIDNDYISQLNVKNTIRATVTSVINAYLDVISAKNTLAVDEKALRRAEESVKQTKMFIKSGRKPGVELVAVKADVANAKALIESDKNNLQRVKYALMAEIGLDPNSKIKFVKADVTDLLKKFNIPKLNEFKELSLKNDIQYQSDIILLEGSKQRSLKLAKDNAKWELNLTGTAHSGDGNGGGPNSGLQSLVNGVNQTNSFRVDLTIPINDKQAKAAVAQAKISLIEANLALKQEKWNKETSAINAWNSIFSLKRSLSFAKNAQELQEKTYNISFQKYSHGLIDSLQLQSAQQQLITSSQSLNSAYINYLKALVNLDQMIGRTLQTWNIDVDYKDCSLKG